LAPIGVYDAWNMNFGMESPFSLPHRASGVSC
jgi:hypothetical protein